MTGCTSTDVLDNFFILNGHTLFAILILASGTDLGRRLRRGGAILRLFKKAQLDSDPVQKSQEGGVDMKEFVLYIVKHLVDKPDEVQVNEIDGERTVVYELRVGQGDMGKVIGRRGQTAKSIRTLLAAASAKTGKRAVLEILE